MLSSLVASYGCTYTAPYNPEFESTLVEIPTVLLDGKALIWTTTDEDQFVHGGYWNFHIVQVTRWNFHLGEITREIAIKVFSRIFKEGADHSNSLTNLEHYSVVVTPRPLDFSFVWKSSIWRYDSRHEVEISLQIVVSASNGEVVHQKTYSGIVDSGYYFPAQFNDKVSDTTHQAITELLNQAALDTYDKLRDLGS